MVFGDPENQDRARAELEIEDLQIEGRAIGGHGWRWVVESSVLGL